MFHDPFRDLLHLSFICIPDITETLYHQFLPPSLPIDQPSLFGDDPANGYFTGQCCLRDRWQFAGQPT
jgi:hypothetical protein